MTNKKKLLSILVVLFVALIAIGIVRRTGTDLSDIKLLGFNLLEIILLLLALVMLVLAFKMAYYRIFPGKLGKKKEVFLVTPTRLALLGALLGAGVLINHYYNGWFNSARGDSGLAQNGAVRLAFVILVPLLIAVIIWDVVRSRARDKVIRD